MSPRDALELALLVTWNQVLVPAVASPSTSVASATTTVAAASPTPTSLPPWAPPPRRSAAISSITADFFRIGGNSLKAMVLVSRIGSLLNGWRELINATPSAASTVTSITVTRGTTSLTLPQIGIACHDIRLEDIFIHRTVMAMAARIWASAIALPHATTAPSSAPTTSGSAITTAVGGTVLAPQPIRMINELVTGKWETTKKGSNEDEVIEGIPSSAQRRIYLDQQLRFSDSESDTLSNNAIYHIPLIYRVRGASHDGATVRKHPVSIPIDIDRLSWCLSSIVHRHEALRTTLRMDHHTGNVVSVSSTPHCFLLIPALNDAPITGALTQRVTEWPMGCPFPLEVQNVVEDAHASVDSALKAAIHRFNQRPFLLHSDLMIRATVFRHGPAHAKVR